MCDQTFICTYPQAWRRTGEHSVKSGIKSTSKHFVRDSGQCRITFVFMGIRTMGTVSCFVCGIDFRKTMTEIARTKSKHFCGRKCFGETIKNNPFKRIDKGPGHGMSLNGDPCWIWAGRKSTGGYGRLSIYHPGGHLEKQAHRHVYELLVGEIPSGLQLDHLCRNRACCNPKHLEPVTPLVNVRRGLVPTALVSLDPSKCVAGHDIDIPASGKRPRSCPVCYKKQVARFREKKAVNEKGLLVP